MAIYHYSAKIIGRSSGRSATAAAAYRSGECITDHRTALVHDYTAKAVDHSEILLPEGAPGWMGDRSQLWNAVEEAERRKDAQLAREFEFSLPNELSNAQNIALAKHFLTEEMVKKGMIVDACFHALGTQGHCHAMATMRHVSPDGFGKKNRDWNRKEYLEQLRVAWANHANAALAAAGHSARIDHRSLVDQGITDRQAQFKLGAVPAKRATEASRRARSAYAKKLWHNRKCRQIARLQTQLTEQQLLQNVRTQLQSARFTTPVSELRITTRASRDQAQREIRQLSREINTAQPAAAADNDLCFEEQLKSDLSREMDTFDRRLVAEQTLARAKALLSAIARIPRAAIAHFNHYQEKFAHGWRQHQSAEQSRAVAQFRQYEQETNPVITAAENRAPGFDYRDGAEPGFSM